MNRLVSANVSKRLGAFLLDAFMVIILGTLLYSGFAQIFIKTPTFSEATKIMNEILVETHLYKYDETYDINSSWWKKLEEYLKGEDK